MHLYLQPLIVISDPVIPEGRGGCQCFQLGGMTDLCDAIGPHSQVRKAAFNCCERAFFIDVVFKVLALNCSGFTVFGAGH